MNIRCKCGHEADYDAFRSTPVCGELPAGEFQCPRCSRAWALVTITPARVGWSGVIIPGDRQVVEIGRRL